MEESVEVFCIYLRWWARYGFKEKSVQEALQSIRSISTAESVRTHIQYKCTWYHTRWDVSSSSFTPVEDIVDGTALPLYAFRGFLGVQSLDEIGSYFRFQCCYLRRKRSRHTNQYHDMNMTTMAIGWPRAIYHTIDVGREWILVGDPLVVSKYKHAPFSMVRCRWDTILNCLSLRGYHLTTQWQPPDNRKHVLCDARLYACEMEAYLQSRYNMHLPLFILNALELHGAVDDSTDDMPIPQSLDYVELRPNTMYWIRKIVSAVGHKWLTGVPSSLCLYADTSMPDMESYILGPVYRLHTTDAHGDVFSLGQRILPQVSNWCATVCEGDYSSVMGQDIDTEDPSLEPVVRANYAAYLQTYFQPLLDVCESLQFLDLLLQGDVLDRVCLCLPSTLRTLYLFSFSADKRIEHNTVLVRTNEPDNKLRSLRHLFIRDLCMVWTSATTTTTTETADVFAPGLRRAVAANYHEFQSMVDNRIIDSSSHHLRLVKY